MAPTLPPFTFPTAEVRAMLDGLSRLGYDPERLMAAAGLSRATLADPDLRVSCEACGAIFRTALQTRPIKNLMLRLAEVTTIGEYPLLDYLVVTSETVGAAAEQLSRYFRLITTGIEFVLHTDEDPIRVAIVGDVGMNVEFDVAVGILHLRTETEGRFSALGASIAHPVDDVEDYERVLRCPVRSPASWSGWLIAPEVWRLPMPRRDPILRGLLERQADALIDAIPPDDSVIRDVRRVLAARGAGGEATIETVARELATTPRTLQRRLAAAGSSFQTLVELTRRETAERYLTGSALSIAEIGYLLGYSEVAAFHRAFKRWSGRTPHAFRAEAAAARLVSG